MEGGVAWKCIAAAQGGWRGSRSGWGRGNLAMVERGEAKSAEKGCFAGGGVWYCGAM